MHEYAFEECCILSSAAAVVCLNVLVSVISAILFSIPSFLNSFSGLRLVAIYLRQSASASPKSPKGRIGGGIRPVSLPESSRRSPLLACGLILVNKTHIDVQTPNVWTNVTVDFSLLPCRRWSCCEAFMHQFTKI